MKYIPWIFFCKEIKGKAIFRAFQYLLYMNKLHKFDENVSKYSQLTSLLWKRLPSLKLDQSFGKESVEYFIAHIMTLALQILWFDGIGR